MVVAISLPVCKQRTSQFSKCDGNRMEKLSKLLDWRREWCVPGTLSYTDFVDSAAITYLPLRMLVENHSELYMRMNAEPMRGAAPRCTADLLQWAAAQGVTRDQQSSVQGSPAFLGHQLQHTTSSKKPALGRSMAAKCCHCILAAEFVFHPGWGDIKDARALAFFRLLHLLWENGKNRNLRGGGIPWHVVLLHKGAWLTKLSAWRLIIALCGHSLCNVFLN